MAVRPIHHGCHTEAARRLRHGFYWAEALILDHFTQRVFGVLLGVFKGVQHLVGTMYQFEANAYHFRLWQLSGHENWRMAACATPHPAEWSASLPRQPHSRPGNGLRDLDCWQRILIAPATSSSRCSGVRWGLPLLSPVLARGHDR